MISLLILTSIVIFLLLGVLFVPINIVVDTNKKKYYMSLPGYLRIDLLLGAPEPFKIKLRVFFISFFIEPFKREKKIDVSKPKENKKKVKAPLSLIFNLIKSIKLKYCYANIDTGNFPLNAQLIPAAQLIRGPNLSVNINFENTNSLNLRLKTRGIKLLTVLIKHKLFNK
ncbi:MAG: hypothetical protein JXB34_06655 [Bacteroidales bacterium]|nr:hypothetical protein [Bacteroidales bacterium]